jgi:mRNA interferase MazF
MSNKYKQGDIVLIPFPYSDLSQSKKRPVVIISNDKINKYLFIVAKVTSVIRNDRFSYNIFKNQSKKLLNFNSEARTNELFTVHKSIIIKKITSLKSNAIKELTEKIKENISVV